MSEGNEMLLLVYLLLPKLIILDLVVYQLVRRLGA